MGGPEGTSSGKEIDRLEKGRLAGTVRALEEVEAGSQFKLQFRQVPNVLNLDGTDLHQGKVTNSMHWNPRFKDA